MGGGGGGVHFLWMFRFVVIRGKITWSDHV